MASLSNPAHVYDSSTALSGTAYTTACGQNTSRSFLAIQYQGTGTAYFSLTNPSPANGAAGAFALAGYAPPLVFSPVVPDSPVYLGTGTGTFIVTQG